ncbi:MAG: hypothetical protein IH855_08755 [Bacteroidetes bacterium]|nr:hypothetical protein [Bacteroidota bacterium]
MKPTPEQAGMKANSIRKILAPATTSVSRKKVEAAANVVKTNRTTKVSEPMTGVYKSAPKLHK